LIGKCGESEDEIEKTMQGYSRITSEWVLTAAHCVYHPHHGLAQAVRVRIPDVLKYQNNRSHLPMLDGRDKNRNRRFLTLEGRPVIHPSYVRSPDSFSGQDLALVKLSQYVERVGLPLHSVNLDFNPDVLVVGGYPAELKRQYHLHVSASRYVNMQDKSNIDTQFRFKRVSSAENGYAMIYYNNQVTPGQSGGPISAYMYGNKPGAVIGIHCNEDDLNDGENSGTLITREVYAWICKIQQGDSRSPTGEKRSRILGLFE